MLSLMELSNVVSLFKRCQGCSNVVRTVQTLSGLFKRCQDCSNVVGLFRPSDIVSAKAVQTLTGLGSSYVIGIWAVSALSGMFTEACAVQSLSGLGLFKGCQVWEIKTLLGPGAVQTLSGLGLLNVVRD
jgi:hypothetical protein